LINVSGVGFIDASGSVGASGGTDCGLATLGAPGAVRLVANSVSVTGGVCAAVFRIEAPSGSASYSQGITYCDSYAPPIAPVIATINTQIVPTEPPSLQVVSIGGYAVPPNSGSSFSTIDLLLPYQLQDPIPVVVQATNVPPGSPVTINFSDSSTATFPPANLAGTSSSSTATLYVSGLNRVGIVYLFVSTTFDASQVVMNIHPSDGSAVARVELASALGRRTRYRFLRRDNTEVNPSELPSDLRTLFGL